jgi:RNA polymerase sigma-70 factor, ECF subfamily
MGIVRDDELIERILSGERQVYAELVRRYHPPILRLCLGILRDRALADDMCQEVFIKAYERLASFRGQSAFSTWLYRIATNHCLEALRRRKRERSESLDALLEAHQPVAGMEAPSRPERILENADFARRVLRTLPEEYQTVLILREGEGLSYEEIAKTMNCSLDSVKARLKRARRQLEETLRHLSARERI